MVGVFRVWRCPNRSCALYETMVQKDDSRHAEISVYWLTDEDLKKLQLRE